MSLYPDVKAVHMTAAALSGTLFLLRGIAVQLRARWPRSAPVRYASYVVDTVLLAAGLTLATILPRATFAIIVTIAVSHSPLGPLAWLRR